DRDGLVTMREFLSMYNQFFELKTWLAVFESPEQGPAGGSSGAKQAEEQQQQQEQQQQHQQVHHHPIEGSPRRAKGAEEEEEEEDGRGGSEEDDEEGGERELKVVIPLSQSGKFRLTLSLDELVSFSALKEQISRVPSMQLLTIYHDVTALLSLSLS